MNLELDKELHKKEKFMEHSSNRITRAVELAADLFKWLFVLSLATLLIGLTAFGALAIH